MTSQSDPATTAPADTQPFRYTVTDGLADLLASLNCTLAATTYQAGKLVLFRPSPVGRLSALFRTFDSAMGLAVAPDRLAIGARHAVWVLRSAPDIARQVEPRGTHDACFVPRSAHITGDIRIHEMAWCQAGEGIAPGGGKRPTAEPELWFVNTRFSCLCTLHADYSFLPRWRPPFISALEPEDRCHLNGVAVVEGRPAYVSALGMTGNAEGWRADKARGGVVLNVGSGQPVTTGMAMPHSPRVHNGKLLVLNSGQGALEIVDVRSGKRDTITRLPGYARGLALIGRYAFVGLSRIREKREFGGLPIEQVVTQLKCGVACVDIESGRSAGSIEFEAGCDEVFDVQLLPHMTFPAVVGLQKDAINGVFIVPPSR
jgi:uncharacterized protein (TIGR03032 family)